MTLREEGAREPCMKTVGKFPAVRYCARSAMYVERTEDGRVIAHYCRRHKSPTSVLAEAVEASHD